MEYDKDKVDEYTLALLYLVTHEVHESIGARAWKPGGLRKVFRFSKCIGL
jgi:hypothetical protein